MQQMTMGEAFKRVSGSLQVGPDGLRFESKDAPLTISDIESVEYGIHGATTNPSVRVQYRDSGETRDAYFEDARYFGYAGFFGGTRRLAEEIGHPGQTVFETEGPKQMQKLIVGLAVALVLMILLRFLV